ncbi:MAG: sulfotransferase family 2 domain-containing protein [Rhodospirillales bacterium]|nr:sulfotransferase family 2 domain-containing protein [Rhodospirillales bacterium]
MNIVENGKQLQAWMADKFLGHPVIFHHVPKCAGTSVARALRMRYLPSQAGVVSGASFYAAKAYAPDTTTEQVWPSVLDLRERVLVYHMFCGVRCIAAHVRFSECAYENFNQTYKFVTILREPVSRYISHYFWDLDGPEEWARLHVDLEEFVETEQGARYGVLFGEFYSGLPSNSDFSSPEAVEAAKRNLEKFSAVGFVEDMASFQTKLKETLGVSVNIRHQNKGKVEDTRKKRLVTPELRRKIEQLCAPDIEIYEFARRRFG